MRTVMVRYTTETDYAAENERRVHAVFDALRAGTPNGLRYTTYRAAGSATFVHFATVEGENPLLSLPAFKEFQSKLAEHCVEKPIVLELSEVDSYQPPAV